MWPVFKPAFNLLQRCFCFLFWFFDHKACGVFIPWPGIGSCMGRWSLNRWIARDVCKQIFKCPLLLSRGTRLYSRYPELSHSTWLQLYAYWLITPSFSLLQLLATNTSLFFWIWLFKIAHIRGNHTVFVFLGLTFST